MKHTFLFALLCIHCHHVGCFARELSERLETFVIDLRSNNVRQLPAYLQKPRTAGAFESGVFQVSSLQMQISVPDIIFSSLYGYMSKRA